MSPAQPPKPRRRIAGETKPGEAPLSSQSSGPKFSKPKLPKRPKAEPPVTSTVDLPAAPPRSDAVRVPRAKLSTLFVALLIAAVAAVAFGTYGVWHGVSQWRTTDIVDSRREATDAAASASETIFSYRYNALDQHLRTAQATMTPEFAKKFRSISPALKALAPQRRIQVKAVVRYAAAKECGDRCSSQTATVLIFLDQARISSDTPKPTVFGNRIEVSMVDRHDKWLVDNIKAL